jgi:hypothetical protein
LALFLAIFNPQKLLIVRKSTKSIERKKSWPSQMIDEGKGKNGGRLAFGLQNSLNEFLGEYSVFNRRFGQMVNSRSF